MSTTRDDACVADGDWSCPVCGAYVRHTYAPGRKRVYCSNACKQSAYRWRCRHGVRVLATPWRPASRAGFNRAHVVRPAADFVGRADDHDGRRVTLCGTFARPANRSFGSHDEFVAGGTRSCRTCTGLIGADPAWAVDYPPGRVRFVAGRWDWVPNSIEQRRADYAARSSRRAA